MFSRGCQRRFILIFYFRLERERKVNEDSEGGEEGESKSRSQELRKECLKRISSKVKKGQGNDEGSKQRKGMEEDKVEGKHEQQER